MEQAMNKQVQSLDDNVDDTIKKKTLQAELDRLDDELKFEIKEIKNTPINKDHLEAQAKTELDYQMKANARKRESTVEDVENEIEEISLDLENRKSVFQNTIKEIELEIKRKTSSLKQVQEIAKEKEERDNLLARQDYDKALASVNNSEAIISLRVEKAERAMKERKKEIEIKLDKITAKTESQADKLKCWKSLYEDIKQIGLKVGDGSK